MATKTLSETGVLGLYTETALHCGAEGGTGYVDLPIQRERHTHYPLIPGSTIKGVLRDELLPDLGQEKIDAIFGKEDTQSPGTVSFGDGILVAFPVRSSGAPFHWVTCPFVLERVFRSLGATVKVSAPGSGRAWGGGDREETVLLEEIRLKKVPEPDFFKEDGPLGHLLKLLPAGESFSYTRKLFARQLLIVSDHDFKEFVETGTEVLTRIKLNFLGTTRTLKRENLTEEENQRASDIDLQGNLFVEEVVPPETLFLAALRGGETAGDLVKALQSRTVIRFGGDETIGRGLTHVTFFDRRNGKAG
ncbi:MAG: type III-B CRISPR module RAMP protein Cmr4 [Thermoanaerobaculia bacterium]